MFREHACKGKISSEHSVSQCLCVLAVSQLIHSGLSVSAMKQNPFPEETQMPQPGESQHFPEVLREAVFCQAAFLMQRFTGGAHNPGTSGILQLLSTIS